ncbi:hypothetical protein [Microseira wollei]|nr:hypothetical protein [Microseira wollei]
MNQAPRTVTCFGSKIASGKKSPPSLSLFGQAPEEQASPRSI